MKIIFLIGLSLIGIINTGIARDNFRYELQMTPVSIPNLPGLHSYAFAQHDNKWLIIGGRKDGLHARQPFNSFPAASNNTDIYVIDVSNQVFWSVSINSLPAGIAEQLQSTNKNFHQVEDTLYIIGGYAFSATANNHLTFPSLTTVQVSLLMNAVISNSTITPYFKQISDNNFAVTGGQLGFIGNTFYLIGGHRFDGRYNPHGPTHGPGFSQSYTNQIRKFTINNSGTQLSYSNYQTITDAIHLHRRDYNLLPQIFPDGTFGYTISSGVFQITEDLPFLYPVEVTENGYTPVTGFNQYLSNYHCATASLYDSISNEMHSLFFGGMSRYYYQNGQLVQDDLVPFVKTISRMTRYADGSMHEFQLPVEMPGLKGASAEFIINPELTSYKSEIILLNQLASDTIIIGHVFGGILSPGLNPFSNNQTQTTSADNSIYAVSLIRNESVGEFEINGKNPFSFEVLPNPSKHEIQLTYDLPYASKTEYFITSVDGKILMKGQILNAVTGKNIEKILLDKNITPQLLFVTMIFDKKYFAVKKIVKE